MAGDLALEVGPMLLLFVLLGLQPSAYWKQYTSTMKPVSSEYP